MKRKIFILIILVIGVVSVFGACQPQAKHRQWHYNDTIHWRENAYGETVGGVHEFEGDVCTICGYEMGSSSGGNTGNNQGGNHNAQDKNEFIYVLNEDRASYTLYGIMKINNSVLDIPLEYNGLPVTAIRKYAFASLNGIKCVKIPSSVIKIGQRAFSGMHDLETVEIKEGVRIIGEGAFASCTKLTKVTLATTITTMVDVFDGCNSIEYNVYDNAKYLGCDGNSYFALIESASKDINSCTVHANTKIIAGRAFSNCRQLQKIQLNSGLKIIDEFAYYDCTSLTSITIPASVSDIRYSAFSGCIKLVEVYNLSQLGIEKESLDYGEIGKNAWDIYTDIDEKSKLTTKDGFTFYDDSRTPYLLDYSGNSANVVLPEFNGKNYTIYRKAFVDCKNIVGVTISDCVVTIMDFAFSGCEALKSIFIGSGVEHIYNNNVFEYCRSIESISVSPDNDVYYSENNCLIEKKTHALILGCATSKIPNDVTSIGIDAFKYSSITSLEIPSSVTKIGDNAFYECRELTTLTMPNSITQIDMFAFSFCDKLKFNIYKNVKYLGTSDNPYFYLIEAVNQDITECEIHLNTRLIATYAFYHCGNIETVELPASLKYVCDAAFCGCGVKRVVTHCDPVYYANAFAHCTRLVDVVLYESTSAIAAYMFNGCTALTNITIPNTVVSVGEGAFSGCGALKFNVYGNANYLGDENNPYTVLVKPSDNNVTSCKVHDDTRVIAGWAFYKCEALEEVQLGQNLVGIGFQAFMGSSIQSLVIPDSLEIIDYMAFTECAKLGSVEISSTSNLRIIGAGAFGGCSALTSIRLPNSLEEIGAHAFVCGSAFASVTFDDPVGWNLYDDYDNFISEIDPELLLRSAAIHLKNYYSDYTWRRDVRS